MADDPSVNQDLEKSLSLIHATLESTADGILAVNTEGKIVLFNKKFVSMWGIPDEIIASRDDGKAIGFVLNQLKDPEAFLKKVKELYTTPDAESFDILEFKDGRIFERYSKPQKIGDKTVGRVWSFRDVTERKKIEQELNARMGELERVMELTVDRELQMAELEKAIEALRQKLPS